MTRRPDGCGWFSALFRVILPIAMPGVFVVFLLLLIAGWNEFLFAFVLTVGPETRVLMVRLLEAGGRSYVLRSAGGVLILLPLVPLLLLVQKQLVRERGRHHLRRCRGIAGSLISIRHGRVATRRRHRNL